MEVKEIKKYPIKMVVSSILVVLLILLVSIISITFAWLTTTNSITSSESYIADVEIDLYYNNVRLNDNEQIIKFTTPSSIENMPLEIEVGNSGTAASLIRVNYCIYINEFLEDIATTKFFSEITYSGSWIEHEFLTDNSDKVYSGYLFYNAPLHQGTRQKIFSNLKVTDELLDRECTMHINVQGVIYQGNAYTNDLDPKPWISYPSNWFCL